MQVFLQEVLLVPAAVALDSAEDDVAELFIEGRRLEAVGDVTLRRPNYTWSRSSGLISNSRKMRESSHGLISFVR